MTENLTREQALTRIGFMQIASNDDVRAVIARDLIRIQEMEQFLAEFPEPADNLSALRVHEVSDEELAEASPEYAAHLAATTKDRGV